MLKTLKLYPESTKPNVLGFAKMDNFHRVSNNVFSSIECKFSRMVQAHLSSLMQSFKNGPPVQVSRIGDRAHCHVGPT